MKRNTKPSLFSYYATVLTVLHHPHRKDKRDALRRKAREALNNGATRADLRKARERN